MKITILNDNAPGKGCLSEFGLSFLIEADRKVLLDAGTTDVFLQNAARLGISLDDLDALVLSHGHYDHGNGLQYIS
ncbi:MAG TPA: MBL fold metallo-hydrolase, partial [Bacteroidales bacterium]|nr:MBL fold metallo-hydrolase [Bacteroidales bacterium]